MVNAFEKKIEGYTWFWFVTCDSLFGYSAHTINGTQLATRCRTFEDARAAAYEALRTEKVSLCRRHGRFAGLSGGVASMVEPRNGGPSTGALARRAYVEWESGKISNYSMAGFQFTFGVSARILKLGCKLIHEYEWAR